MNKRTFIFRIAVATLCLLCLVVLTYSWFNRDTLFSGNRMRYQDSVQSSAAGIDMNTYAVAEYDADGNPVFDETNNIVFSDTPVNVSEYAIPTQAFVPGKKVYFKTTITNTNNYAVNANISLYGTQYSSGLNDYLYFGTYKPMKTAKLYASSTSENPVEIPIVNGYEVRAGETNEVEWYLYIDSSCTETNQTVTFNSIRLYAQ